MQINERYLDEVTGDVGKRAHKREIERMFRYVGKEPSEVTVSNMEAYREFLVTELKLNGATVKRAFAVLTRYFDFLMREREVDVNPVRLVQPAENEPDDSDDDEDQQAKWLTTDEVERLFIALDSTKQDRKRLRDQAIISVMLYAGLRVSEVCELVLSDMDLEHGEIRVDGRTIPIATKLDAAMRDWMNVRDRYSTSGKSDKVFVSRDAGSISRFNLDSMVKKYMKQANICGHSSHSLRHTFARRLTEMGVRLEDLSSVMGINVLTAAQLYAVMGDVGLRDAMERL